MLSIMGAFGIGRETPSPIYKAKRRRSFAHDSLVRFQLLEYRENAVEQLVRQRAIQSMLAEVPFDVLR